jgi:BirA family biotin operon repressor/biotin-[acetyl-CoA-carboxylase] ligase
MITAAEVVQEPLSVDRIRQRLFTYTVGRRIELYASVGSTNAALRELAHQGAPEGTVVLAEAQTAGRGRGGQSWYSPPGVNLYASVLFRPAIAAAAAAPFSLMGSLALADAIRELGLAPAIKWPNDVLVQRRKVAGTLAELGIADDRVASLILGVGVNVNVTGAQLRAALGEAGEAATSLREALGHPVDRNAFAAAFLIYLDEWLVVYRAQGPEPLRRAWRRLDVVTGRRVRVQEGQAVFDGWARGVDADGHLEVEDAGGGVRTVVTARVQLLDA